MRLRRCWPRQVPVKVILRKLCRDRVAPENRPEGAQPYSLGREPQKGEEDVRAPKERTDHLRQALAKLEQDADALGPRFDNLDETIDFLEQKEQEIKAVLDAEILGAKANRGQIFSAAGLSREQRALAIGVPQRYEAILLEILQTLRDTRWHLMTTRAEVEDPGDARVYDYPAALLESFTKPNTRILHQRLESLSQHRDSFANAWNRYPSPGKASPSPGIASPTPEMAIPAPG